MRYLTNPDDPAQYVGFDEDALIVANPYHSPSPAALVSRVGYDIYWKDHVLKFRAAGVKPLWESICGKVYPNITKVKEPETGRNTLTMKVTFAAYHPIEENWIVRPVVFSITPSLDKHAFVWPEGQITP